MLVRNLREWVLKLKSWDSRAAAHADAHAR